MAPAWLTFRRSWLHLQRCNNPLMSNEQNQHAACDVQCTLL